MGRWRDRVLEQVWNLMLPPPQRVPRRWLYCPVCDERLVGPWPSGMLSRFGGESWVIEPSREELVAKCPVHGRPPYNDGTLHGLVQLAYDEPDPRNPFDHRRRLAADPGPEPADDG